jgi:beta-barrel assembly-enhancing protease
MKDPLVQSLAWNAEITRRGFIRMTALVSAGYLAGCATNPVTGESQLMLVSETDEIAMDRQYSPHQFSGDYGPIQDESLNRYIDQAGKRMAAFTHRPSMPYSFRGVNATYVNAYAFPGGSIACTRGILLALESEAELAALLGHEMGHVNARHTAERMSKGMLIQATVGGLATVAGTQGALLGDMVSGLGNIGAGALLAKYSRDNERQADALGMDYMYRSGYNTEGMIGLMDVLRSLSKDKPGAIELMFSTHPMSDERYQTAASSSKAKYPAGKGLPLHRERYMDQTAGLRAIKGAIEKMQSGQQLMAKKEFPGAESQLRAALKEAPDDYAGLVMMAQCQMAQKKYGEARAYAKQANHVYPQEAQAYEIGGIAKILEKDFDGAHEDFAAYDKLLPGNPGIAFLNGFSLEGMKQIPQAAKEYHRYLQAVNQGDQAKHAYSRLVEWGYIKPSAR